jgi:SAM-dependent methyltransferase
MEEKLTGQQAKLRHSMHYRKNPYSSMSVMKKIKTSVRLTLLALVSSLYRITKTKDCYECPICSYYGRFRSERPESGERRKAICPRCGALDRHRLQYLVFREITRGINTKELGMLHFAPEKYFSDLFRKSFNVYVTADLNSPRADRQEDLRKMSFDNDSFDFFFASHVLEHVKEDLQALSEIRRVLKNGGIAVIPVPIIGDKTIEYPEPNPHEHDHVRCPGKDYYERYRDYFSEVKLFYSGDFDEKYQVYIYEDRTAWPSTMPLRPLVPGERHTDIVAVCYK